jgi:uncharacterized DUF497 family protein
VNIDGFDWDAGNSFKNESKHGLSRDKIEAFFVGKVWVGPDPKHSHSEDRFVAIGKGTTGKFMVVAFTFREKSGKRLIRPISARLMHEREARKYEQAFAENEK